MIKSNRIVILIHVKKAEYLEHYDLTEKTELDSLFLHSYPILSENESTYCTMFGWLNFDKSSTSLATSDLSFVVIRDTLISFNTSVRRVFL